MASLCYDNEYTYNHTLSAHCPISSAMASPWASHGRVVKVSLSSMDLKEVRNLIYDARLKWYDIGVELNIDVVTLDCIKSNFDNKHGQCLLEVLKLWLKSHIPPTWNALADALAADPVNEKALAVKGKETHGAAEQDKSVTINCCLVCMHMHTSVCVCVHANTCTYYKAKRWNLYTVTYNVSNTGSVVH